MPTNTYTPIGSITLAATSSEVTFASIPSTYRDLILVFSGDGNSGGADISIRLNGDTGANYNRVFMNGNGSSASSGANSNVNEMDAQSAANGRQLNMIVNIMDASATDKHKSVLLRDNDAGFITSARAFRWANTASVTSLTMFTSAGAFTVGSTFSLYGVVA